MARPRSFDEDAAVDRAMILFWRQGIARTSVRSLGAAMGLGPGSLYGTFGSRSELLRRALQRYVRALELGPPSIEALHDYLRRVVAEREPRGCLLAVAATELPELEPEVQQVVRGGLLALQSYLLRCLEPRPSADHDAAVLATLVWGLQLRHRVGEASEALSGTVNHCLRRLQIPQ